MKTLQELEAIRQKTINELNLRKTGRTASGWW